MAMSRKDYEAVAEIFRAENPKGTDWSAFHTWSALQAQISAYFEVDNERFDPDRFSRRAIMPNDYDIVAYTYRADEYCPACIVDQIVNQGDLLDAHPAGFDTENYLDRAANILGINREDESSYDSDDFPKPCMRYQMTDYEDGSRRTCAECHEEIS